MIHELVSCADEAAQLATLAALPSYAEQSSSANTRRAYRTDWQHFTRWCAQYSLAPLPADVHTMVDLAT